MWLCRSHQWAGTQRGMRSTQCIQRRAVLKGQSALPRPGPQGSPVSNRGSRPASPCPAPRAGTQGPARKFYQRAVLMAVSAQQERGPLPTKMHRAVCLSSSRGTQMGRSEAHEGQDTTEAPQPHQDPPLSFKGHRTWLAPSHPRDRHRHPSQPCRWIRRVQISTSTAGTRLKKGGQESTEALPLPAEEEADGHAELPAGPARASPQSWHRVPLLSKAQPPTAGRFMGVRSPHASETEPSAHRKQGRRGYALQDPLPSLSWLRRERQPCRELSAWRSPAL